MKSLDELLNKYLVTDTANWGYTNTFMKNERRFEAPVEWYAVLDDDGIIAYFANEKDANAFRLMKINMELNS